MYVGYMKNGIPHGTGEKIWFGGRRYKGDWENGCRHGYGTEIDADGKTRSDYFERDISVPVPTNTKGYPAVSRDQKDEAREFFRSDYAHLVLGQQRWNESHGFNAFSAHNDETIFAPNHTTSATRDIQNEKVNFAQIVV